MNRRSLLAQLSLLAAAPLLRAEASTGHKLAQAARAQLGVTKTYDPRWTAIPYPLGDVPRSTGVCADVIVRAARDGLGLDLQKLVHEDISAHFDDYPARQAWGQRRPDANIDHRRVLILETYFTRTGARLWAADAPTAGDAFPGDLAEGDILTWLLSGHLPHIGIVVSPSPFRILTRIVHNIGRGVEDSSLGELGGERAIAHYRWPVPEK